MSTITHVVVPLAGDVNEDWTAVGPNFQLRGDHAIEEAKKILAAKRAKQVRMVLAAGKPWLGKYLPKTLGELCAEYVEKNVASYAESAIDVVANNAHGCVWGTYAEIAWVFRHHSYAFYDPTHFTFVTELRHLKRVQYIVETFFPEMLPRCNFVESGYVAQTTHSHELFAYVKLRWLRYKARHQAGLP